MIPSVPGVPERALAQAALAVLVIALVATLAMAVAALLIRARVRAVEWRRARRAARWTPRLFAVLDGDLPADAFARSIWPHQRDDALRFLVTYAVRLKGGDRRRLADVSAPLLPVVQRYLASRSPEWRAFGAHTIGLLSPHPPLVQLGTLLRDPSRSVALAAARALSQAGGPPAARALLTSLSRFGGAHMSGIASLLAGFGLRAGPALLEALLRSTTGPRTRVAAAEALLRLSYTPAAGAVRTLLQSGTTRRETRAALLRLLGEIGGPTDAPLVRSFCDHPDPVLRVNAVTALGHLRATPADLDALRHARSDPDVWVALRASEALGDTAEARTAAGHAPLAPLGTTRIPRAVALADPGIPAHLVPSAAAPLS